MSTIKNISVSITIPTLKTEKEVKKQMIAASHVSPDCEVIASCIKQSAAKNRNWCIDNAKGDIIIMMDDDITGFFPGWCDILIDALFFHKEFSIVSARPKHADGGYCPILGDSSNQQKIGEYQKCIHTPATQLNICGSACVAFWRDCGIRFDEEYQGATYEDSDFCMQMNKKHPDKQIVFANKCDIIHNEEKKGRGDGVTSKNNYWKHNHEYFAKKWGIRI